MSARSLAPLEEGRFEIDEETFNVVGSPGPGKPEPTAEEITPAADQVVTGPLTSGATPPEDMLAEVLGPCATLSDRALQAWQWVEKMTLRGILLGLDARGKVSVKRPNPEIEPLSANERTVLGWLKPSIVAELRKRGPKPPPDPSADPGDVEASKGKPAPRVRNPAEIRRMIGAIAASPASDYTACERFARRLVNDPAFVHGDRDPERSYNTYLGWARAVKQGNGELTEHVLIDAFEDACGPKKKNRGAAMVAAVKRLKSLEFARKRGPRS